MKIVFMGTPEFSVPALISLKESAHEIKYVITQQDKAKDRGKKVQFTPVKEKALEFGIEVLQPGILKGNTEILSKIQAYAPDLIVVAAYGKILPKEWIDLPRLGCVNIHASLLPRWRGAAPIQRSIMEGDEETGVAIMRMSQGLDTGDVFSSRKTLIQRKTSGQLHDELSVMGAALLMETLPAIENGTASLSRQDESLATYAPMIYKQDGHLDFSNDPAFLERLVRGLAPWPGAYATYQGEQIKIWEAFPTGKKNEAPDGTITEVSEDGMEISAGGKTLLVTEIQMPGKRKIKIKEYIKGNKIEKFSVLG